jgi:hypothetical protein
MQMYRKIAVAGATAAAIVGVGTAALATSGSSSTAGSGSQQGSHQKAKQNSKQNKHNQRPAAALRRGIHGQLVTKGKDGFVVHSGIRGTVTSVTATSITVKAADGYSQTFTMTKDTKVRERPASGNGKGTAGKAADLKSSDKVAVIGKKAEKSSARPSATVVIDGLKK